MKSEGELRSDLSGLYTAKASELAAGVKLDKTEFLLGKLIRGEDTNHVIRIPFSAVQFSSPAI